MKLRRNKWELEKSAYTGNVQTFGEMAQGAPGK